MSNRISLLLMALLFWGGASAQIITADPAFPTINDEVVITFDATLGTGGLLLSVVITLAWPTVTAMFMSIPA